MLQSGAPSWAMAEPRILASLAAFGDAELVTAITLNALRFLSPALLALHTSASSAAAAHCCAPNGTLLWLPALRPHSARLLANPVHVRVHTHASGDVLAIHLLNVRLLLDSDPFAQPDDRVVILPANAVFFQPCAPLVRASPMSFLPGQSFSDYPLAHGWPDASSSTWVEEVRLALAGNDTALRRNTFLRNIFHTKAWDARNSVDGARPTPLAPSPLAYQTHEGSWYPLGFLSAALSLLNGTAHDPRLWAEGRGRCGQLRHHSWLAVPPPPPTCGDVRGVGGCMHPACMDMDMDMDMDSRLTRPCNCVGAPCIRMRIRPDAPQKRRSSPRWPGSTGPTSCAPPPARRL